MDLSPRPVIYAAVIPSGISDWTEIKGSPRKGFDPNGYPSTKYIRADLAALEYERGRRSVLDAITYTTPDGLPKRAALSRLLGYCDGICAADILPPLSATALRAIVAEVDAAFGMSKTEKESA